MNLMVWCQPNKICKILTQKTVEKLQKTFSIFKQFIFNFLISLFYIENHIVEIHKATRKYLQSLQMSVTFTQIISATENL